MRRTGLLFTSLLAAAVALPIGGCHQAYFRTLNLGAPAGHAQTIEFDAARKLSLDVYRPRETDRPAPVVVFFHGGTWSDGSRDYYRFVGESLSRRGVMVVIPDYRKAPANVFPAFMEDAANAVAWAHSHVQELGGDPARIYLMGHSAGAHMAALLGTDASYLHERGLKPRDFAGVIGLSGPYDFLPLTHPKLQQIFGREENWPRTQPVNFVDGDEPPFLLLHGGGDFRVEPSNSERLAARLRAAGTPVTLRIFPRKGHIAVVNGFVSPRFSPVLKQTLDWIGTVPPAAAGATAGRTR